MSTSRRWWPVAGLVVGGLGLAVSYLAAALLHVRASPVVAVAEGVIAKTPGAVAEWAITNFKTNDKTVLLIGIFVILAILFAVLGAQARRRWWVPVIGYAVLAAIGVLAVSTKPASTGTDLLPVLAGLLAWLLGLALCVQWLDRWEVVEDSEDPAHEPTHTRRSFFLGVGGLSVAAVGSAILGRLAGSARRRAEESRRLLRIDGVSAPVAPSGVRVGVEGVTPWETRAQDFYVVDTAVIEPTIVAKDWELRIHGMVDREVTLTYDDLVARKITQDWITLNCVSNQVGGDLIGNAWWSGVRLAPILAEAGPRPGADAVLQTSDDGWTCGTPLSALMDRRNAMLAVAMNGEPLPIEHGFPVRTIVPGLYGYVSACKWVVDIEVTRFADISAYWTDKGWSEQGPVKMSSRVDVPAAGANVPAGDVVVAGVAWSQHTGISAVEVSLDGGTWTRATLGRVPNDDTWAQWRAQVHAPPGDHEVRVRAIDKDGTVQTGVRQGLLPDGATGWDSHSFTAEAAR